MPNERLVCFLRKTKSLTLKSGDELVLRIDRLSSNGGRGVGRYEGVVIFVPFTAPGELLRARVKSVHRGYVVAECIEILERSSFREDPPCEVFSVCGGCTWQHVHYQEQLRQKQQMVESYLNRHNAIPSSVFQEIVASPRKYHYRNRIQVHTKGAKLGLLSRASNELVPIRQCWIADDSINKQIDVWYSTLKVQDEITRRFEIRAEGVSESSFSQVNPEMNEILKQHVYDLLTVLKPKLPPSPAMLELYSGNGNFTEVLTKAFPESAISTVESDLANVNHARKRFFCEAKTKPSFFTQTAEQYFQKRDRSPESFDLIFLDPPRSGVSAEVLKGIHLTHARTIVYISCDPITFARDLKRLGELNPVWCVRSIQLFDMFPQTEHVELMAHLECKDGF